MHLEAIRRHPRKGLVLLALLTLLPGTWNLPLIDRDEPRFAHATVEMMARGEWVVPYFNGEYRFDKPPLTYWWMRVHFLLLGTNEFAARLHSTEAALFCGLLLFGFARRLGCDPLRSFFAGAGWLTCLQVLFHGRMAVADMPLILFLVLTMRALWELHRAGRGGGFFGPWFWVLHGSIALGFLAKGPLAYLIPLLAILLWGGANRLRKRPTPNLGFLFAQFVAGLPVSLGIIAAWAIPALVMTNGAFAGVGLGKHVVERGVDAFNNRLYIPGVYYLLAMLPFLLPWSPRIPHALKNSWKDDGHAGTFLLAWFLAPFLIFSFYATQLPHYILPGYPAFFLLLFLTEREHPRGWVTRLLAVFAIVLPLLGAGALVSGSLRLAGNFTDARLFLLTAFGLAAALVTLGIGAGHAWGRRPANAIACVVATSLILIPVSENLRRGHATLRLRAALDQPLTRPASAIGFTEPSLVWYFHDDRGYRWKFPGEEQPETEWVVVERRRWRLDKDSLPAAIENHPLDPARDRAGRLRQLHAAGWRPVAKSFGFSPATSSIVELHALRNPDAVLRASRLGQGARGQGSGASLHRRSSPDS